MWLRLLHSCCCCHFMGGSALSTGWLRARAKGAQSLRRLHRREATHVVRVNAGWQEEGGTPKMQSRARFEAVQRLSIHFASPPRQPAYLQPSSAGNCSHKLHKCSRPSCRCKTGEGGGTVGRCKTGEGGGTPWTALQQCTHKCAQKCARTVPCGPAISTRGQPCGRVLNQQVYEVACSGTAEVQRMGTSSQELPY